MSNEIMKKLSDHDKEFEKIDKRFEKIDKEFSRNDDVHSNLVKKLLEHDDRFDEMLTENKRQHDEVMGKFDQVLGAIHKLDDERLMGVHRADRMQGEIDINAKDIKVVKKVLKIA